MLSFLVVRKARKMKNWHLLVGGGSMFAFLSWGFIQKRLQNSNLSESLFPAPVFVIVFDLQSSTYVGRLSLHWLFVSCFLLAGRIYTNCTPAQGNWMTNTTPASISSKPINQGCGSGMICFGSDSGSCFGSGNAGLRARHTRTLFVNLRRYIKFLEYILM